MDIPRVRSTEETIADLRREMAEVEAELTLLRNRTATLEARLGALADLLRFVEG